MNSVVYKLSDSVLMRIVQILQESILTGVDLVDLMRQMELTASSMTENGKEYLELTLEYVKLYESNLQKLLDVAENHASEQNVVRVFDA
jgi:hypothetical protein